MHNLLILDDDSLNFIQEPFISEFLRSYWNKIAHVFPIVKDEKFSQSDYFEAINRGILPDWLFAIAPNPHHPLDIDWIFLKPRQHHPWQYGDHPATKNFNGGGSTACLYETLELIEVLSEDSRIQDFCVYMPELYSKNPPKTFESLYCSSLFRGARQLSSTKFTPFDELYKPKQHRSEISKRVCLGLYGCNEMTLSMKWQVESLLTTKSWMSSTLELANKVTLALRLAGHSDCYTEIAPSSAFGQYEGLNHREPLLIRFEDDILLCSPPESEFFVCDAYFLDCPQQKLKRLGLNGQDPNPILRDWGIHPGDARLEFLFDRGS